MKGKIFLLFAVVAFVVACNKVGVKSNDNKAIDGVRNAMNGKWKALFLVNGSNGDTITATPGSQVLFNFGTTDSAFIYLNDSLTGRSDVRWETNQNLVPGLVIVVMDATPILPKLGIEGIYKDTLFMFAPDGSRTRYVYKR